MRLTYIQRPIEFGPENWKLYKHPRILCFRNVHLHIIKHIVSCNHSKLGLSFFILFSLLLTVVLTAFGKILFLFSYYKRKRVNNYTVKIYVCLYTIYRFFVFFFSFKYRMNILCRYGHHGEGIKASVTIPTYATVTWPEGSVVAEWAESVT